MSTSPQATPTFADRAALLTQHGIRVVPLLPRSKQAFLNDWQNLATTDGTQIAKWNEQNRDFNCAAVADDNFWILDVDNPAVFEQLKKDIGHSLDELDTLVVRSSGEKRHFYFKHDDCSRAMGNRDCDLNGKEAFSVRANKRYVVGPDSIHPTTGEPYQIVNEPAFGEITVAAPWFTDWIMACTSCPKPPAATANVADNSYLIPEGNRDNRLFEEACKLRDLRHPQNVVLTMLQAFNRECCKPPMSDADVIVKVTSAFKREPRGTATVDEPENSAPTPLVPEYPMDTIDGDLIGELSRALSDGTFIPPQFVRENIKVVLGLLLDGWVGFPNHEDLHLREYLHNVSVVPQSGKGESFKLTIEKGAGFLRELLEKSGMSVIDGGSFGSGEFMVKVLKDAPTHRCLTRFDEMSEVWTKARTTGCILEKKFLTLFESTSVAQGSFKNGSHAVDDLHYAHIGDFTQDSFEASFTGSGSRGSGYLSRCVFQFSDRMPHEGDWVPTDTVKAQSIVSAIGKRLDETLVSGVRIILQETDEARAVRLEFFKWLDTQDARFTSRLKDHLKRDAVLRAVFSGDGKTITAEVMARSIAWCRNQFDNRLALFPEDAGSLEEVMERRILKCISDGKQATERELKKACHLERAGSGGFEVFNRAMRSLTFSHEIRVVGKTRSGSPVYSGFEEAV